MEAGTNLDGEGLMFKLYKMCLIKILGCIFSLVVLAYGGNVYCEEPKAPPPDGSEVAAPANEQNAPEAPEPKTLKDSKKKKKPVKKTKNIKKSLPAKSSTAHTNTTSDASRDSASVTTDSTVKGKKSSLYGMEKTLIGKKPLGTLLNPGKRMEKFGETREELKKSFRAKYPAILSLVQKCREGIRKTKGFSRLATINYSR